MAVHNLANPAAGKPWQAIHLSVAGRESRQHAFKFEVFILPGADISVRSSVATLLAFLHKRTRRCAPATPYPGRFRH